LRYYKLSGIEVHEFSSVSERIQIGKQLYSILFSKQHYDSVYNFANYFGHSGSRSDYWPHLYTKDKHHVHKIYSPSLSDAWKDVSHSFPTKQDWFNDKDQIKSFEIGITINQTDITKDVKRDLNMLLALGKLNFTKHKLG
jgi:hypothetical protein